MEIERAWAHAALSGSGDRVFQLHLDDVIDEENDDDDDDINNDGDNNERDTFCRIE